MLGELRLFVTFGNKATGSPSPAAEVAGTQLLPARCLPAFLPTGFHSRGASLHLLLFCARLGDLFTNSVPEEAPGHFYRGLRGGILPVPSLQTPTAVGNPPPPTRCSAEALLSPGTPPAFPALH